PAGSPRQRESARPLTSCLPMRSTCPNAEMQARAPLTLTCRTLAASCLSTCHNRPVSPSSEARKEGAVKRQRFAQRRKAAGYTQEQFAERLGVDRSTVARWESADTEPQPWLRPKIARALGVSLIELDELLSDIVSVEAGASARGHAV